MQVHPLGEGAVDQVLNGMERMGIGSASALDRCRDSGTDGTGAERIGLYNLHGDRNDGARQHSHAGLDDWSTGRAGKTDPLVAEANNENKCETDNAWPQPGPGYKSLQFPHPGPERHHYPSLHQLSSRDEPLQVQPDCLSHQGGETRRSAVQTPQQYALNPTCQHEDQLLLQQPDLEDLSDPRLRTTRGTPFPSSSVALAERPCRSQGDALTAHILPTLGPLHSLGGQLPQLHSQLHAPGLLANNENSTNQQLRLIENELRESRLLHAALSRSLGVSFNCVWWLEQHASIGLRLPAAAVYTKPYRFWERLEKNSFCLVFACVSIVICKRLIWYVSCCFLSGCRYCMAVSRQCSVV